MNLLSMKAVAWREDLGGGFFSPQRKSFVWSEGIVARACTSCPDDKVNPNCTCGLYSSPNPEALPEYAKYPSCCFVLLENYGWADIWTGPRDLPNTYVLRSWGAQIVGVVGTLQDGPLSLEPHRFQTALLGVEKYNVKLFNWNVAKKMIEYTWMYSPDVGFSPFDTQQFIPAPAIFYKPNTNGDDLSV